MVIVVLVSIIIVYDNSNRFIINDYFNSVIKWATDDEKKNNKSYDCNYCNFLLYL